MDRHFAGQRIIYPCQHAAGRGVHDRNGELDVRADLSGQHDLWADAVPGSVPPAAYRAMAYYQGCGDEQHFEGFCSVVNCRQAKGGSKRRFRLFYALKSLNCLSSSEKQM